MVMVAGMRNLRLGVSLIGFSIFSLLILRYVPGTWLSGFDYANSTVSYIVLAAFYFCGVYLLGLQSLEYFRLPRMHYKTGIAVLVGSYFVISEIVSSDNVNRGVLLSVRGVIFLLAIGLGEEIFSRGFVFGALHRFGQFTAIFISSFMFGLMHLNLYTGKEWDPWEAYWHVMNTFSFGVFACALMIVTRSIWIAVVFHALCDWSIIFDKASGIESGRQDWDVTLWEGLTVPFVNTSVFIGCALVLLWIDRGNVPAWVWRVALKWKLIDPELSLQR